MPKKTDEVYSCILVVSDKGNNVDESPVGAEMPDRVFGQMRH